MSAPQTTPAERLALSRERLRSAMSQSTAQRSYGLAVPGASTGLLDLIKTLVPGAGVLIDTLGPALKQWWARHPLHTSGVAAGNAVQTVLRTVAQRHPVAVAAGAVVLGALVIWSRPWRGVFKPKNLWASLGPALLSSVLASAAVQSWIASVLANKDQQPAAPDQEPPAASE